MQGLVYTSGKTGQVCVNCTYISANHLQTEIVWVVQQNEKSTILFRTIHLFLKNWNPDPLIFRTYKSKINKKIHSGLTSKPSPSREGRGVNNHPVSQLIDQADDVTGLHREFWQTQCSNNFRSFKPLFKEGFYLLKTCDIIRLIGHLVSSAWSDLTAQFFFSNSVWLMPNENPFPVYFFT